MSDSEKPKLVVSTGPFKNIVVLGHASVDDYDKEAGKVGSCLEDADTNVLYRSTLPDIHDKALKEVESLSSVSREANADATAKAQARENAAAIKANREAKTVTVHETPVTYFERVKALVDEATWASIDAKFREVALATPIDASPSKRVGQPPKDCQEKAAEILTRDDAGVESALAKLGTLVPNFDLETTADGRPDAMSLARFIQAYTQAQKSAL